MKQTFKKTLFFAAWCVAFLVGTVAFYSCSNEDLDEDSVQTKAELFRAKAKELSKKYGVDVTLNEENIEEIAETMTIEQLEEDFQKFATMEMDDIVLPLEVLPAPKKLRHKNIKKLREEINRNKIYEGSASTSEQPFELSYKYISKKGVTYVTEKYMARCDLKWSFQNQGVSYITAAIELGGGTSAQGSDNLRNFTYTIDDDRVNSISASGEVKVTSSRYVMVLLCTVDYSVNGPHRAYLSKVRQES